MLFLLTHSSIRNVDVSVCMTFHVKVYCNICHRECQIRLRHPLTREEIEHKGRCENCSVQGQLRFICSK